MPSIKRRRVTAVAVVSLLASISLSMEAAAKSKSTHSRSRAAPVSRPLQSSGVVGYQSGITMPASIPPAGDRNIYSRPISRGNVIDNTAGGGNVGAF
jgi:hypothetical protein